jgi:bla regulator protein BlaR1
MQAPAEILMRFLAWIGNETLQVGLLISVIGLLLVALGRLMTPGWRHALWLVLMARMLCPWRPVSRFSLYRLVPWLERSDLEGTLSTAGSVVWMVVWLTGALSLLLYIVAYHWRLRRRVAQEPPIRSQLAHDILDACCEQLEVRSTIRLRLTRYVQVPTLLGCFRPRLLIPRSMASLFSRRRLQHVFLHELAHHRRCDIFVRWLSTFCQVVHWFNPLVWLAFYTMRSDCELACDRLALSCLEPTQPRQYGQTLIRLVEHVSYRHQVAALAAGLAQDRFQLKKRLRTIGKFRPFTGASQHWPALLLVLLALTGLTDAPRAESLPRTLDAQQWQDHPAQKYYVLLREQPGNSYLFDRFYEAWLESDTLTDLESFLKHQLDQIPDAANRLILAFCYERQGRDAEAVQLYRQGGTEISAQADFLFFKARAEARQLEFATAMADLQRVRNLPCSEELALKAGKLLGELYIRTHQRDKASALWQELLAQGADNEALYEDLIELQIKEGLFDEALKTSRDLIAITRDPYQAVKRRLRQGDIHQYKRELETALAVYSQALRDVGQGSWLENQIVAQIEELFERDDDLAGLCTTLGEMVQTYPQRVGLKKRLARRLVEMDRADEALTLYQEILQATPGDKANQKAYVEILTGAGQQQQAIDLLEDLADQHRQDGEILLLLADLYHQNQQDDRVIATLNRFIDMSGGTEVAYLRVTGLLDRFHLQEQAAEVFRQLMNTWPESLTARLAFAEFLYQQKRVEEALAQFRQVADQGNLQMMIQASNAAGAHGHYDRALTWVEARYEAFSTEVTYLNHLCKLAIRLELFDRALVWAQRQLELAETYPTIRVALSQVLTAAGSGEPARRLIQELESRREPTIQQICLLSELLEGQHLPDRADVLLQGAAAQHPDIVLRQQIHIDRLRRDWDRAAARLETLIDRTGKREIHLIRDLVELYEKSHRIEDALRWVQIWQAIAPSSAAPRLRQARLLGSQGRHQQALALLDGAQREFEDDADVLMQLADLYRTNREYEAAQRVYWRLYAIAPNAADRLRAVQHLCEIAEALDRYQELIERLQRERQRDRDSAAPLLALAAVYKHRGLYEEHRQALMEASRIETDDLELLFELARVEEAQGDWEKAAATLRQAMALDPTSEARLKLARLCVQQGNQEDGMRLLTELAGGADLDPRDAESIAATLMSMGRWEFAIHFLQGLLSRHARDYRLHYQYAVALEEAGRTREAAEAFVDLLGFQDEMAGQVTHPTPFTWTRQGLDTQVQQILPVGSIDLLRVDQFHERAYRYRRERQRAVPRASGQHPQTAAVYVTMPASVYDLHLFALSHCLHLAEALEPAQRLQVQYDLDRHGVPNPELLLKVSAYGWDTFSQAIDRLAEDYPDHKAIQGVWILHRTERQGCTLAEADHIFRLFETSHPRLALIVGLRCYGKHETASRLFTRSMQMLRQLPSPGYYEAMAIAVSLQQQDSPVTLTPEQRAQLDAYLLGWYGQLNAASPNRAIIFDYMSSLLRQQDSLSGYIKLLDEEVARYIPSAAAATGVSPAQPLITNLPCPPVMLPGFPDAVLRNIEHALKVPAWPGRKTPLRPTQLARYLKEVKDPVLKIVLAMAAHRFNEAEGMIDRLRQEDPTSLVAYLLDASLSTQRHRPREVVTLLDKARSLPMSARDRSLIDGALVASAMELDPQQHARERDIGKHALVRLMSRAQDPWQREELIVAADAFGVAEQAESLRRQVNTPPAASAASSRRHVPTYVRGREIEIIEDYLKQGQTDSALRLSVDSLRSAVDGSLRPHYTRFAASTTKLVDLIKKRRLTDRVLEYAKPAPQASAVPLAEYGRIFEVLGRGAQAQRAYEQAIGRDPLDPAAHVHLIVMQAETAPEQSTRALLAVDPCCLGQVGSGIVDNAQQLYRQNRCREALALADCVTDYLTRVAHPETLALDWVDRVAEAIADATFSARSQLSPLYLPQQMAMYQTSGTGGTFSFHTSFSSRPGQPPVVQHYRSPGLKPVQSDSPLAVTRRQSHNRLCQAMLKIPQLAEAGFSRLAAEARGRNALTGAHVQSAREALLISSPAQASGSGPAGQPATGGLFWNKLQRPAEFLVEQTGQAGTLDRLLHEFVPLLKQKGQTEQAERLTRLIELYRSNPLQSLPPWGGGPSRVQVMPSFPSQPATSRAPRDPNRARQRLDASRTRRTRR